MGHAAVIVTLLASTAFADPSGKKWFLDACQMQSQCVLQNGNANGNRVCTMGRCLPEVRFAATIDNAGRATLPGQQQVPMATVIQRMYASFERWTFTNASCDPAINFAYLNGLTYSTPQGLANVGTVDNENNVIWLGNANWRHSSLTLGLTTNTFFPGELIDSDMEMNAATVTWGGGTTISGGDYDYESVVTHEAGHFIGFDHTANTVAVMFASIGTGQIKRNLAGPDINDVCAVYPGVPGSQGAVCSTGGVTCQNPLVCEGAPGGQNRICTRDCASAGAPTCPTGFSCQASTNGFACLPQIGTPDMCRFCTSGQDCSTGVCLTDGMGRNWCSLTCNPAVAGQCGNGFTCQMTAAGNYCIPTAACTNQCTAQNVAMNCAPGYGCTNGTCTPLGMLGARCEISSVCPNCAACATDDTNPQIAFCRACCNDGQPVCAGCSSTTCGMVGGQATMCFGLTGRQERLCYPSGGAQTCQPCSTATPCAGGAQCLGGFCRASCNPSAPGACPACQANVNGGFCACTAQEVSDVNQACSATGTMLAICRNGLSCVGGFCRQRCNADPNSCPVGSSCQASSGQQVCLPSNSGQQCAPCGASGQCQPGLTCYANRCYPPCSVALPNQCSTCVQVDPDPPVGSGAGICACPDQIVGPGSSCLLPEIASCQPGTRCLSGFCEGRCDPMNPNTCPIGRVCTFQLGSEFYCQEDTSVNGGGSAGTAGGTSGTGGGRPSGGVGGGAAGGGNVNVNNMGCTCQSVDPSLALFALAGLIVRARWRRR
jgi:hypothetical protein